MNAEIVAVGTELLLGQIVNSNAQFLSKHLAELGINVYYHTVVGDNPKRLKQAIHTARSRSNLIIFTGGLGPTKDDLTKETIASLLGKKLITDDASLKRIEDYFIKVNRVMTENNKKQAIILEDSESFPNENGMAPGMGLVVNGITYMLFPGPPKEMKPMYMKYGRKFLINKLDSNEKIISRVLRFFGIGESKLETVLMDLIDQQINPTIAPYAGDSEVTLRLTAKHQDETVAIQMLDEMEQQIQNRVGQYLYGYDETTLVEEVMKKLIERKLTLASAESLTGGLFGSELTAISGASEVFKGGVICYTNAVKENVLLVNRETLTHDGAVSEKCAKLLAENVQKQMGADIGISFTGIAGPSEVEGKPVGTVYIGLATNGHETKVFALSLAGTRQAIRSRTVKHGLAFILQHLKMND